MNKKATYPDDPIGVMKHKDRYKGGKALIVLGGQSAAKWAETYAFLRPDVLLGANGVNAMIYGLDFWLCAENMNYANGQAEAGDPRAKEFMQMFHRSSGAKTRLISHHSWNLLEDRSNCISIKRMGYERGEIPNSFSLREYGEGLMAGWAFRNKKAMPFASRVGTVGSHLLHMAGILGCDEVHTIGFDLIFRDGVRHHWYDYPVYQADKFRTPENFIEHNGVKTQEIWLESARFLKTVEPYFKRDGLKWVDHSDGLLKIEGLECTK